MYQLSNIDSKEGPKFSEMSIKNTEENKRSLVMFRLFIRTLRKGFWVFTSKAHALNHVEFDKEMDVATTTMTNEVKEGYFTVFTVQGKETQRFVIELGNLTNPAFLSLLEQAREEYGFEQKGALSLPCRPQELQKILSDSKAKHAVAEGWPTTNATIY